MEQSHPAGAGLRHQLRLRIPGVGEHVHRIRVLREPREVLVRARSAAADVGFRNVVAAFGDTQCDAGDGILDRRHAP